jgi:hypothetical protein
VKYSARRFFEKIKLKIYSLPCCISIVASVLIASASNLSAQTDKFDVQRPANKCDELASNPSDTGKRSEGVALNKIDYENAITNCKQAVTQYPNSARLKYNLARSYFAGSSIANPNNNSIIDEMKKTFLGHAREFSKQVYSTNPDFALNTLLVGLVATNSAILYSDKYDTELAINSFDQIRKAGNLDFVYPTVLSELTKLLAKQAPVPANLNLRSIIESWISLSIKSENPQAQMAGNYFKAYILAYSSNNESDLKTALESAELAAKLDTTPTAKQLEEFIRNKLASAKTTTQTAQVKPSTTKETVQEDPNLAWSEYSSRNKTLLEQVMNYTTTGYEDGLPTRYWVGGTGTAKCALQKKPITDLERQLMNLDPMKQAALGGAPVLEVNIRNFTEKGFRITNSAVGDEQSRIPRAQGTLTDRLQKAWGIAFNECPGKKTAF